MKKVMYFVAVLVIVAGINSIVKGERMAGAFLVLLGILIFPTISETISQKFSFWQFKGKRFTVYIGLLLLIGVNIKHNGKVVVNNNHSKTVISVPVVNKKSNFQQRIKIDLLSGLSSIQSLRIVFIK